jgi:hypothetical protein
MRTLFIIVIVLFALMAVVYILGGVAMIVGVPTANTVYSGSQRQLEILDGLEGLGFGIVYAITALGLYKRRTLALFPAAILVLWNLFGSISNIFSGGGIISFLTLFLTALVPICLLSRPVREEFTSANAQTKVA